MDNTAENNEPLNPILFNRLKHHTEHIKSKIEYFSNNMDDLRKSLLVIGDSQLDLYFGKLSPDEICRSVISQLKQLNVLERKKYCQWLRAGGNDYRLIILPDKSFWALRLADDQQKYIHIHPGRYSPRTMRVKALQLKTAIAVLAHESSCGGDPLGIAIINLVRKEVLNESPIKSVDDSTGLMKIIKLLSAIEG